MRWINGHEMLSLLKEVADGDPGFIYPKEYPWRVPSLKNLDASPICLYKLADGSGPGCIVGNVLDRLGVLDEAEEDEPASTCLNKIRGVQFSDDAMRIADYAQQKQDQGSTWAESVEWAEERFRTLFRRGLNA